ncbi:hypothetical protein BGZ72_002153 [Mortierella alpina]|nr:hypothetical protein BGZ72_002153 [Mortierella alpina]
MAKPTKKPREKTLKVCPLCKTDDQSWHVKKYYISLDSILFMCENSECLYPFHDEALFDASLKRLKVPVYVDDSVTASSSAAASSSVTTSTTTTATSAAAAPAEEEKESTEVAEPAPEEFAEANEKSTEATEPTLAQSAEIAPPSPLQSSLADPLRISVAQSSAVNSSSTTQSFLESTPQVTGQHLTSALTPKSPLAASPPPAMAPVKSAASPPVMSAPFSQHDVPTAALTPKRKRSCSEDADVEDDLTVEEPSHKRRSRSIERAFAVTPPPPALGWSGASPSTSPHLTSDSEPSSPLFNQQSFGYSSDDSWTRPSTPADFRGFSGIDMSNLYVAPSNATETGTEDDLEKLLFADMPMTDMADLQAFSSQLGFGHLDQGDDLDQLLLQQMDADHL